MHVPVTVFDGSASPPLLRDGSIALVKALPNARHTTLEAQSHGVDPAVLAEALTSSFRR